MYPKLFHVSFLNTYGLMVGIGIIAALFLYRKLSQKTHMSESSFRFYGIALVVSIGLAFVFARLFQMIYNLAKTGKIGSGITFLGGLIGGVATFFIIVLVFGKKYRSDMMKTVNIAMPCITLGHFFGRIGCFFAGCCYGKETDSFLGVKFVRYITEDGKWVYGPPRLPTQLFEALFLLLLTVALLILIFKFNKLDFAAVAYLYGYGVFRFLIEFLRDDERGAFLLGLSPSQVISIIMVIGATALTIWIVLKKKKAPVPEEFEKAQVESSSSDESTENE